MPPALLPDWATPGNLVRPVTKRAQDLFYGFSQTPSYARVDMPQPELRTLGLIVCLLVFGEGDLKLPLGAINLWDTNRGILWDDEDWASGSVETIKPPRPTMWSRLLEDEDPV